MYYITIRTNSKCMGNLGWGLRVFLASSMVYATIRLMRPPLRAVLTVICLVGLSLLASAGPLGLASLAQEETADTVWLELVNETRLDEGLDPYAQSRLLSNAAQRHADDFAENGLADLDDVHEGSDGTDEQKRIREAGYAAWTKDGEIVVGENVWYGRGTPQDALASFLEDQGYRDNLMSDTFREIGIGRATNADGRSAHVLSFGARPNVLPIFINDGAASTENREVAIRLTNERVRPQGEGAFIGEAIEIRISNKPSFEGLAWQSWAPLVSWVLPDSSGEHMVYVQFRDAAGRTAASADGIFLDEGTPTTPTAVSTATPTPPTPTPQATDTAAPVPSPTPEPSVTSGPATSSVGAEPTTGTGTAEPPTAPPVAARATPFPTWTPLPSPAPTPADVNDPGAGGRHETSLSLPKMEGYERPLAAVGILQGVVIVLGVYWLMRRGKGG